MPIVTAKGTGRLGGAQIFPGGVEPPIAPPPVATGLHRASGILGQGNSSEQYTVDVAFLFPLFGQKVKLATVALADPIPSSR